jgi:ribose transport system substrate-binding protein
VLRPIRILLALIIATALSAAFAQASEFFNEADLIRDLGFMEMEAEGPADQPWIQAIDPTYVDTSQYAKDGPWTVCFSNAGVNNPWRVVGFTTMEAEVDLHPNIGRFIHIDAEGSDNKQISDINGLLASGDCDILIVSPNTTAALTPVVETACEQLPVIVFDRGVNTDCPVSFIKPIGGYAFGAVRGQLHRRQPPGGRQRPGPAHPARRRRARTPLVRRRAHLRRGRRQRRGRRVHRGLDRQHQVDRRGLHPALRQIDAIWMDAGATAVAAIEAFEDSGAPYPIITGEDQQDFLLKWRDEGLTALAPTFPTYQWRTPIIAAEMILSGEPVPPLDPAAALHHRREPRPLHPAQHAAAALRAVRLRGHARLPRALGRPLTTV